MENEIRCRIEWRKAGLIVVCNACGCPLSTYHQRNVSVNADVAAEEILDESLAVAATRVVLAPAVCVVGRRTHLEPFFQKIINIVGRNVEIIYTNVILLQKLGSVLVKHSSWSSARYFVKLFSIDSENRLQMWIARLHVESSLSPSLIASAAGQRFNSRVVWLNRDASSFIAQLDSTSSISIADDPWIATARPIPAEGRFASVSRSSFAPWNPFPAAIYPQIELERCVLLTIIQPIRICSIASRKLIRETPGEVQRSIHNCWRKRKRKIEWNAHWKRRLLFLCIRWRILIAKCIDSWQLLVRNLFSTLPSSSPSNMPMTTINFSRCGSFQRKASVGKLH